MTVYKNNYFITTDKNKINLIYVHQFLSASYWAENISLAIVEKSIQGSECFSVFDLQRQIGFARVITDKTTFGYLADVFIDEAYRGRGLSKWLIQTIMEHPELQGFRSWVLATKDAHGLYAQFGFKPLEIPERYMRKYTADIYKKSH
jgi:GNAT superfamily N-acetyltransferase